MQGLRKSYGDVVALDGVDLTIAAGEICALLGPNGAGKTTLVATVCGLRRPDRGSVTVNGVDAVSHPEEARRHLGYAPQELAIYPTVRSRGSWLLRLHRCQTEATVSGRPAFAAGRKAEWGPPT